MGVKTRPSRVLLALTLLVSSACQAKAPTQVGAPRRAVRATSSPAAAPSGPPLRLAGLSPRSVPAGPTLELVGAVRLISDQGGGIISNHSGGIISNNSGALISDQGGGIISNHSGGLVSNNSGSLVQRYALRQAAQAEAGATESWLADALVQFFDAAGHPLVDAQGKAIEATTDREGAYRLQAALPPGEPVVARVALYNRGELRAMVVPEAEASGRVVASLNTASSLGAAFVLDTLVKGQVPVYQRLPAAEAKALLLAAEEARRKLGALRPKYEPSELLGLAQRLKAQDLGFSDRLDRIEAILLAGQANGGEGLPATQVAISRPVALWQGPGSSSLVFYEAIDGRRRQIDALGRLRSLSFSEQVTVPPALLQVGVPTLDGGLLLVDGNGSRVLKLEPKLGDVKLVAGVGQRAQGALPVPAVQAPLLNPSSATQLPDGRVWLCEAPFATRGQVARARLMQVDLDGTLSALTPPPPMAQALQAKVTLAFLAARPDGSILAAVDVSEAGDAQQLESGLWLWRDGAWLSQPFQERISHDLFSPSHLVEADGSVLLVAAGRSQVWRWREGQAAPEVVVGDGQAGFSGDGGPAKLARLSGPRALGRREAGGFFVADTGNGLVREVTREGLIRTVAGARGVVATGDALTVALNGPGTPVATAQGALMVPEIFSGTIKRLQDGRLEAVAGSAPGFGGDGGPASQAQFDGITCLAKDALEQLFLVDSFNYRIRAISPQGQVRTVAGTGSRNGPEVNTSVLPADYPAHLMGMANPLGIAVDAEQRPWFTDAEMGYVWRLDPNGMAHRMVAQGQGDALTGGIVGALGAGGDRPSFPAGLALGPEGRMLMAEVAGMRLWREKADHSAMEPWAGLGVVGMLAKAAAGEGLQDPPGTPLGQASFVTPISLAVAPDGTIAVGEIGTERFDSLAGFLPMPELPPGVPKIGARVRLIRPNGTVDTLAGDGGQVLQAKSGDEALGAPIGLAFDHEGRLVIADGSRNQLKLIPKAALAPPR